MSHRLIVAKFGGTSCSTSSQINKLVDIVVKDPNRRLIVVSAPGTAPNHPYKVTDLLYEWHTPGHIKKDAPMKRSACKEMLIERYKEIARGLGTKWDAEVMLTKLQLQILAGASRDYVVSRGEYFNADIIAEALGFRFIDAAKLIAFDKNGSYNKENTLEQCRRAPLLKSEHFVIPGFFGSKPDGEIQTFSRGGSDITGAIMAAATNAELYENWTDVNGILMTDPRIVASVTIQKLTYGELRELAYSGANVFHAEAMFPVEDANIVTNVRNTNNPDHPGTMIYPGKLEDAPPITGIAGRKGFTEIRITKRGMNSQIGFLNLATTVLKRFSVSLEHPPTGIDRVSLLVNTDELNGFKADVMSQLKMICDTDKVEFFPGIALIAVVGRGMQHHIGSAAKVLTAIADAKVNVKMLSQGGSEISIIVGVAEQDLSTTISALHSAFKIP
jgi:aspartate kinase